MQQPWRFYRQAIYRHHKFCAKGKFHPKIHQCHQGYSSHNEIWRTEWGAWNFHHLSGSDWKAGSQKHIMSEMFTYEKSPFYESTRCIHLEKIDRGIYGEFIRKLFGKDKRILTDEALEFILDWTRVHTHYTQVLCNVLFSMNFRKELLLETTTLDGKHYSVYNVFLSRWLERLN